VSQGLNRGFKQQLEVRFNKPNLLELNY